MKRILVSLMLLVFLLGCTSGFSDTNLDKTGIISGVVKSSSYMQGSRYSSDTVIVNFVSSLEVSFFYSGGRDNTIERQYLGKLLLLNPGDVLTVTYKRIESYPMENSYPTKDIVTLSVIQGD